MSAPKVISRNPWSWVSTLYLAEGLPYVVVMTVAVILYKELGISNADIAFYTSWLYLPWVIKPLWSPVVDILKTRRSWIWVMQLIIGGGLAGVALTLPDPRAFQYSLAFFWLLAFSSATHDIAIDGFYLLATTEREQAFFVGIRSTFYRLSMIFGQGLLVIFAGFVLNHTGLPKVNVVVNASHDAPRVIEHPELQTTFAVPQEGPLRILAGVQPVEINLQSFSGSLETVLKEVKDGNLQNGFLPAETNAHPATTGSGSFFGWLGAPVRGLGNVLGPWLRKYFAPKTISSDKVSGGVGALHLCLSRPPGHEIVVTTETKIGFGLKTDESKNFSVVEGARLVFNDQNWNKKATVLIQLDPKLKTPASATLEIRSGNIPLSWAITFALLTGLFICFAIYHRLLLPYPPSDQPGSVHSLALFWRKFFQTFGAFFGKSKIGFLLLFLLFYRFAEAQLVKMVVPFLLDAREAGGLGLTTGQLGFAYGTVGIAALTCGGLLGGFLAAKQGLKFWLWWMVLAIHLPDAVFVYLSYALPHNFWIINACVAIEQFGYGFGFTAYMLYMIYIARGEHATAHYAICTGFMALGMLIPGMFSGWLQEIIGYQHFFVWVLLATIPGFFVVKLIPLDPEFGRKETR
jgi:PAT family beta-lactamase induction signal transducer AmpG